MKIRDGLVSNSSSSSFTIINQWETEEEFIKYYVEIIEKLEVVNKNISRIKDIESFSSICIKNNTMVVETTYDNSINGTAKEVLELIGFEYKWIGE